MDQKVIIMFITNMIQYAVRGYEVDAMDYVVKPVEYFSFHRNWIKQLDVCALRLKNFLRFRLGKEL